MEPMAGVDLSRITSMTQHFPTLGERTFHEADQNWFAATSGDHNPIHVDPLASRRSLYGRPLVHGVHVALWALDAWCSNKPHTPARVVTVFAKPVFVDETVRLIAGPSDDESSQLRVQMGDAVLTTVRVKHGPKLGASLDDSPVRAVPHGRPTAPHGEPMEFDLEQLRGRLGVVGCAPPDSLAGAFPSLASRVGGQPTAELAALSALVGMQCPGLHSIFGGFDVRISDATGIGNVHYEVTRTDAHLSAVRMSVRGPRIEGSVTALVRPRPVTQPPAVEIAAEVGRGEFAGMRAVIVGGSRGLGETTAKIITAGGGHVALTWCRGEDDALSVAREIRSMGGTVDVMHLDVAEPTFATESVRSSSQLFYFASPRITSRRLAPFEPAVFEQFIDVYVDGLHRVVEALTNAGASNLSVFYPSSVFVGDPAPGNVEYAAAKAAGEVAVKAWISARPSASLVIERLPRLATDQTASFRPTEMASTVATLLPVVRRVRDASQRSV